MSGAVPDPALAAARAFDIRPPARLGVATSGGPDSLAALVLLARVAAERGVTVFALHVDHGLRTESPAEAALVRRIASEVGAGFAERTVDVRAARASSGGSIEQVARALRHQALADMAAEHDLTHVALAHHQGDQVETVLLSILRGAWPGALAGMPATRPLRAGVTLVRPFLAVPHEALRAHAAPFEPACDPMNVSWEHRRVAVRLGLLPALRVIAPDIDAEVLALARDAAALDARARAAARGIDPIACEPGLVMLAAPSLRAIDRFGRAQVLRTVLLADPALGAPAWPVAEAWERALHSAVFTAEVRRGVMLAAREDTIALYLREPAERAHAFTWTGEAVSVAVDAMRRVRVAPADAPGAVTLEASPGSVIEIRTPRAGDRFPLAAGGHKRVADELADRKVHPAWRARVPLVFVNGVLRWIAGVRVVCPPAPRGMRVAVDGPMPWSR